MTLNVLDRISLLQLLPERVGSFREMREVQRIRKLIILTEEELESAGYKGDGQAGRLNAEKAISLTVEYDFTEEQLEVIGSSFALLEADGAVPTDDNFVSLYEKFESYIDT